ncbi:hypothetical protein EUGRSUZ_G00821 [Eucalyptus grandis]|uniref:Uncharacterized protein n=2 Tax=Eucalyptus grandis TaxID=71139 RepID=A0ACC3K1I6_EUCGR|nr:hypothetical protein EUGRSUZ_G00821 [Eucalyptus grandis]
MTMYKTRSIKEYNRKYCSKVLMLFLLKLEREREKKNSNAQHMSTMKWTSCQIFNDFPQRAPLDYIRNILRFQQKSVVIFVIIGNEISYGCPQMKGILKI